MRYCFIYAALHLLISCGDQKKTDSTNTATIAEKPEPKTVMAVFAHPDDEIDVSPLLYQLASQGHNVYLTIATDGDMGIREHAKIPAGDSLAQVRRRETACTCEILGIHPPVMLGLGDGKLTSRNALSVLRKRLDSILVIYKPDIVITWGADGGSGHPDHRMVGSVVTEIYQAGLSPAFSKLYYTAIPTEHWKDIPPYKSGEQMDYHKGYNPVAKKHLPIRIHCSANENKVAREAMRCNKSQYPPEELDDNELWMNNMNKDTVYLRPYMDVTTVTDKLF